MRRPRGHIQQRSPGSFRLRYTLDRDPATGKRRTATTTVRGSRKDAERELIRLLRTVDTSEHVDPSRMTVRQWLDQWLETIRGEITPKNFMRATPRSSGATLRQHSVPTGSTELAPLQIQRAYNGWTRQDGKPLSPLTRRYIHVILKSSLARAVEQQLLARNPADVFTQRLPKVERQAFTTLTVEQSAHLLELIRQKHIYWPVLLALTTGMRRGEILALRWKNVELDRGTLRVMESLEQTKSGIRFKAPKTDRTLGDHASNLSRRRASALEAPTG